MILTPIKGVTITGINYEESDPTVYKFGIRIPVVVGYSICLTDRISIAPFTGPEMSYSFAGAMKIHDKEKLELDDTSIFSKFGNQRRFECGWKIGVAFFTGMWSFLTDTVMESWLHSIVYVRNICAHHSRLWNRRLSINALVPRNTHLPFINTPQDTKRVYYILYSLVELKF